MAHRFVSVCVILGLLVTGCRAPTNERPLVRSEPSAQPQVRKAPYHGQYRLYASPAKRPTTATATPVLEARLTKGEPIGFARDAVGGLFAVVRGEQKVLTTPAAAGKDAYVWTMQPDPGQVDPTATGLLVIGTLVIGVVTAVALSVAATPSINLGPL